MAKKLSLRKKIVEAAKKSFYDYGYTATTYLYLAKEIKTSPGSFSYYFSSKAALAGEVYQELLYSLDSFIQEKLPDCRQKSLLHYAVISRLLLECFRQDPAIFRFYYEFGKDDIETARSFNLLQISDPAEGLQTYDVLHNERGLISSAVKGHSWFTNTAYFSGKLAVDYDYYCDHHLRINLLLIKIPNKDIEEVLQDSKKIVDSLGFEVLPYFLFTCKKSSERSDIPS